MGQSPVGSSSERTTTRMMSPTLQVLLLISSLFASALAAPTPQEVTVTVADPTEGVEEPGLVLVVDSNGGSGPLGFGGFGDFGRFPGFHPQQFAGFDDFPSRLPSSFGFEDDSTPEISIDLSDIFGRRPSEDGGRVPGIINTIFDALGGHLGVQIGVEGGEGTVNLHGGEGGPVAGDGEYDHHNSTFDEKTLPDGSVVRVNRTVIKDTDENGNSFFFSSSVHHVLQEGGEEEQESEEDAVDDEEEEDKGDDEEEEEDIEEEEKEGEEEIPVIEEDFNVDQYDEEAELVPTDIDETTNDVDQSENEIEREAKAEFNGTDATASVEDIF